MMPNLRDRNPTDRFHGLVYGQSGAGKTHLCGLFPDPYIIDTDFGLDTLAGMDIEYDEMYVRPGDKAIAKNMWPSLLEKIGSFAENPDHETLVIDSLTTVCEVVAAYILAKSNAGEIVQFQHYVPIYSELTTMITKLRKANCHVILTAHEEMVRHEMTGKTQIIPLVMGNAFTPRLPIYFSNVYNCMVDIPRGSGANKKAERSLLVQPDGTRMAKTQSKTDNMTIEKTFESIMAHIGAE